jgi:nucleoside-diphosphate-sugar epimerase
VYSGSNEGTSEADPIHVTPGADGIYDISKLLGESICLGLEDSKVRVARLSNVYGKQQSRHTFLGSLLEDIGAGRSIVINEGSESSKDYVAITDVVALIEQISLQGQHRIYNIASGMPFSHSTLAKKLSAMTNLSITFKQGAPQRAFPRININRIIEEFGYKPKSLLEGLSELIPSSTHQLKRKNYD